MEKVNSKTQKLYTILFTVLLALFSLLVCMGERVWITYRNTLMNNQKEQMLLIAQTISQSMENSMQVFLDELDLVVEIEANPERTEEEAEALFEDILFTNDSFVYDIRWETESGALLKSIRGEEMTDFIEISVVNENTEIFQCTGKGGNFYLDFRHPIGEDIYLCLIVDSQAYYDNLIRDISVGTNGYITIKNADGLIVMHQSYLQWGIDVIEGRKELYPDADYGSLAEMIEKQKAESSGVYEYYSYWWTEEGLPRVRKLCAHYYCYIGDTHWIISAMVDYSDFYEPIKAGFSEILAVFCGILLLVMVLSGILGSLLISNMKSREEVSNLKEINASLEELHQREEMLSHQQRLQVIGTMTSGIVHEFNNFLTPIVGYADLLSEMFEPDSEAYDYVNEISEAANKARELNRQIASMSRKNIEIAYQTIPAAAMMKRVMKMITTVCPPNVVLKSDTKLTDEEVLGNITQINQVILNICVNGIYAIGRENGELRIFSEAVTAENAGIITSANLLSEQWKHYLHISITDTGIGMDKATMDHIFEPFFTTKKSGEGTGLGLSMADQIIHYHRGHISVESKPGEGSTFHILLPVREVGIEDADYSWTREQHLTFLIADDNQKVLKTLEKEFEHLGIDLLTCGKREEIDLILQNSQVSVLAIDDTFADGFGLDYCFSIKGRYPDMYRILMTERLSRDVLEAKRSGIIHNYAQKPLSAALLIAAVRQSNLPEFDNS